MKKKVYLMQPGKLGDLIVTKPIAEYYKKLGFEINWYIFNNFTFIKDYFEEYNFITFDKRLPDNLYFKNSRLNFNDIDSKLACINFFRDAADFTNKNLSKEDIFLDICWGFPGAPNNSKNLVYGYHLNNKNWIDMRYDLAKVPLKERWNFNWKRNEKKEDELLAFIEDFSYKKYGSKKFSISHNYVENKKIANLENKINFAYIKGYQIFDWYKVLLNAETIECIDSSLCNFVEVLPQLKEKKKYYLGSEEPHYYEFMRNILFNNWLDADNKEIISDYKNIL